MYMYLTGFRVSEVRKLGLSVYLDVHTFGFPIERRERLCGCLYGTHTLRLTCALRIEARAGDLGLLSLHRRIRIRWIRRCLSQSFVVRESVQRHLIHAYGLRGVSRLVQDRTAQVALQAQTVQIGESPQLLALGLSHGVQLELALGRILQEARDLLIGRRYDGVTGFVVDVTPPGAYLSAAETLANTLYSLSVVLSGLGHRVLVPTVQYHLESRVRRDFVVASALPVVSPTRLANPIRLFVVSYKNG